MQKEDWKRIAKWMGFVYAPIILLIIIVFLAVEYHEYQLAALRDQVVLHGMRAPVAASSSTVQ
jgi:hypothetical protein